MMEQNLKAINLYHGLIKIEQSLRNELLPLAGYLGLDENDPELLEATEQFSRELTRHLSTRKIQIERLD